MKDTFIICNSEFDIQNLPNNFSITHSAARCTMELESDGFLSFRVYDLGQRRTEALRKSCFVNVRGLGNAPIFSFVAFLYKRDLVSFLAYRAKDI